MKNSNFRICLLMSLCVIYTTVADMKVRLKRLVSESESVRADDRLNFQGDEPTFTPRYGDSLLNDPADYDDNDDVSFAEYSALIHELCLPYFQQLANGFHLSRMNDGKGKRFFDSLGGSDVHSYKRSTYIYNRDIPRPCLNIFYDPQVHHYPNQSPLNENYQRYALDTTGKRSLDSLGGFQVHGWKRNNDKRSLDSLGGFQVHGWKRDDSKRSLDSLGGFQVHGWKRDDDKRSLDSLGGFQVHGWKKRAIEPTKSFDIKNVKGHKEEVKSTKEKIEGLTENGTSKLIESVKTEQSHEKGEIMNNLESSNKLARVSFLNIDDTSDYGANEKLQGGSLGDSSGSEWTGSNDKRSLDSLGGFQVHGWKRDDDKRALDSLGGFQVHGWKRDDDKRALDSLGGFQVHGWKRDDDKRALDSLGGFQVHGWKRDDDKRALDSLGGFQVHGWKRDDEKRALDPLGGFQVHGWKRDDDKRSLDSLGGFQVHGWKRDEKRA